MLSFEMSLKFGWLHKLASKKFQTCHTPWPFHICIFISVNPYFNKSSLYFLFLHSFVKLLRQKFWFWECYQVYRKILHRFQRQIQILSTKSILIDICSELSCRYELKLSTWRREWRCQLRTMVKKIKIRKQPPWSHLHLELSPLMTAKLWLFYITHTGFVFKRRGGKTSEKCNWYIDKSEAVNWGRCH